MPPSAADFLHLTVLSPWWNLLGATAAVFAALAAAVVQLWFDCHMCNLPSILCFLKLKTTFIRWISGWFIFLLLFTVCDDKTDFICPDMWPFYLPSAATKGQNTIWGLVSSIRHRFIWIRLFKRNSPGVPDWSLFTPEYRCNKQLWRCHGYRGVSKYGSLNPGDGRQWMTFG